MIVDYSLIRPPAAVLKAAGITAVGRYIGWDSVPGFASTGKNITAAEARELTAAGIAVFLAFEYAADAVTRGAEQGRADGRLAISQLAALGAPPGITVYFAADFDLPDYAPKLPDTPQNAMTKLGPVADYFRAIAMLGGRAYRTGAYGGYYACSRLLDAGLAVMAWQTAAWSGGRRDPRAVLYQLAGTTMLGGADVNIHEGTSPDFGQWPRPGQPAQNWTDTMIANLPTLAQGDADHPGSVQFVHRIQALVKLIGDLNGLPAASAVTADGTFGAPAHAGVTAVQKFFGLAADGIVGPQTWAALVAGQRP